MRQFLEIGCVLLVVACGARAAEPAAEGPEVTGTLQAPNRVELRSRVTSTVDKVHFKPGEAVKKGDLLVTLDARVQKADVAKAEADLDVAQAELKLKAADAARAKQLLKNSAISQQEYERVLADQVAAEKKVKVAQAALDRVRLELDFTRIVAPFDGRLDAFGQAREGDFVTAGTTVVAALTALDPVAIDFSLDEPTLLRLQKALGDKSIAEAKLAVKVGLGADKELSLRGTLTGLDNSIDPKTRLLRARALMSNPGDNLIPGQAVKVRIVFPEGKRDK